MSERLTYKLGIAFEETWYRKRLLKEARQMLFNWMANIIDYTFFEAYTRDQQ